MLYDTPGGSAEHKETNMPFQGLIPLVLTAAGVGFLHTLLGPDHYLPFALMARAGKWPRRKILGVTLACGLGHILSSVVLGTVGIALGMVVARLVGLESTRDRLAGWLLIAFGLIYSVWGLQQAMRRRAHSHVHTHADGTIHVHRHAHVEQHSHVHRVEASPGASPAARLTPWILFTIFVTGPCKPLIPLLMYPAAQRSVTGAFLVTLVFGLATLITMCFAVLACRAGLQRLPFGPLERYANALTGVGVAACGLAIQYLHL